MGERRRACAVTDGAGPNFSRRPSGSGRLAHSRLRPFPRAPPPPPGDVMWSPERLSHAGRRAGTPCKQKGSPPPGQGMCRTCPALGE